MYEPLHDVRNQDQYRELIASMSRDGWVGAPLVVDGAQLITGSHRWRAWIEIHGDDAGIPVITLEEVFAEAGVDMDDAHNDHGNPTIDEWGDWVAFLAELPEAIREQYGIDGE